MERHPDLNSNNISSVQLDGLWNSWQESFIEISDKYAPFKQSRLKNRINKWMNPEIIKLIYKREYLHKKAKRTDDPTKSNTLWEQYKDIRNLVTKTIRKTKLDYYSHVA